jgi:hypothetical protein
MSNIPGTEIELLPGLEPLLVAIDQVHPNPENPRVTKRLDDLIAGMRRFGVRWPIVVNQRTGEVEAGHQRLAAMQALGATQVPVLWADDDGKTARAFNLADNRLGEVVAEWDEEALRRMLQDLSDGDWALDGLGWADEELMDLLVPNGDGSGEVIEDEVPLSRAEELQIKWQTAEGQMWKLGNHLIICGDSSDDTVVARIMGEDRADLVVTDPPYGVSYADKNEFLNQMDGGHRVEEDIANDHMDPEEMLQFWGKVWTTLKGYLKDHCVYYMTGPQGGRSSSSSS